MSGTRIGGNSGDSRTFEIAEIGPIRGGIAEQVFNTPT